MRNIIPLYTPANKIVVKSEGCYQYDSEWKKYIDFESGVWCVNIGHSNKRITDLIERQVKASIHHGYRFTNPFAENLNKELLRIAGLGNGSSAFLSSGSEAVNLAITLSKHITGRKKVLKIDNSYLSAYGWGQISKDNDNITNIRFNDIEAISHIDFSDIAAFVLETGGASIECVQFPGYDFVRQLINLSKKNNCPVIAEEVTTGMGRTGKWFGYQHYDIMPDIVVTGKALGNGYPVSAVTVSDKIAEQFEKNPFRYAQSHQNDPLGCAIALEVISIIEEERLIQTSEQIGTYFKEELEKLRNKHTRKITDIRARGLMLGLEFNKDINGEVIYNRLFEKGYITGFKNNTLRFLPPLIITKSDIDSLTGELDKLLDCYS